VGFYHVILLNILLNIDKGEVNNVLEYNNTLYTVEYTYKNHRFTLKDSFLLLPSSLRALALNFKTSVVKGYFPHKFMSADTLEYTGPMPDLSMWYWDKDITEEGKIEYIKSLGPELNTKELCLTYLANDCMSLYKTLHTFQTEIIMEYSIDPLKVLTLPSLAGEFYYILFFIYFSPSGASFLYFFTISESMHRLPRLEN
jgi:hypothetical protein